MKSLDGDYASWFNVRHDRVGHLFQGRFGSQLVDEDTYLLETTRYIVLNPVRAGMVETAVEWPWSSYQATAGLAAVPPWLDLAPILDRLNRDDWNQAMTDYRDLVAAAVGQQSSPWEHLRAQAFLGGPEFLRKTEDRLRGRSFSNEHLRDQRTFRAMTAESIGREIDALKSEGSWPPGANADARALLVLLCRRHTNANCAQIGRQLGITGQRVGRLAKSIEARVTNDPRFAALVQRLERRLQIPETATPSSAVAAPLSRRLN